MTCSPHCTCRGSLPAEPEPAEGWPWSFILFAWAGGIALIVATWTGALFG